jgi:hypothetical protein
MVLCDIKFALSQQESELYCLNYELNLTMMSRTQHITYKGKVIFMMDFSNLTKTQEIQELIIESALYIRSQPKGSVLTLTNLTGMYFSNEVRDLFNNFLKGNKPYIKGSAVVGLSGLQQILYNGLMKVTGRDLKSFTGESNAKEWLIGVN